MGADGQPQIHVQTYVAMIDFGQDIQQALALPRWLSGRFALARHATRCTSRRAIRRRTIDELARRGHALDRWGTGTSSLVTRTASPSTARAGSWPVALIRAATGPAVGY
jgi:gamma-glutamyltranspeptidase